MVVGHVTRGALVNRQSRVMEGCVFPGLFLAAGVSRIEAAPAGAFLHGRQDTALLLEALFLSHGPGLVRLVRLFVDDRNAAEDLVQEAFIRLARSTDRLRDPTKAAAYLRSIALNLARDHNRRGLVSLRHRLPLAEEASSLEDTITLRADQQAVIDALRSLPYRQRDCLILRYFDEFGIDAIAGALEISRNSVKTHLSRGLRALEAALADLDGERGEPLGSGSGR